MDDRNPYTFRGDLLLPTGRALAGILWLLALTLFGVRAYHSPSSLLEKLASFLAFGVLMGLYIGLGDAPLVRRLRSTFGSNWIRGLVPVLLVWGLLVFFALVAGSGSGEDAAKLLLYFLVPFLLLRVDRERSGEKVQSSLWMVLAILAIWIPVEVGALPPVPLLAGVPVRAEQLATIVLVLYLFLVIRRLEGIGYNYELQAADWHKSLVYFAVFVTFFAIPLAISLGFAASSRQVEPVLQWGVRAIAIFFFIAVPEELLFRGIIQNLLHKSFPGMTWVPLLLASLVFGLAHANNSSPPFLYVSLPGGVDLRVAWAYLLLAGLAGVFYGLTYLRTGKVTAAALVHALVDTWWAVFFHG